MRIGVIGTGVTASALVRGLAGKEHVITAAPISAMRCNMDCGAAPRVFSPGIWWIGLTKYLSGSEVQTLQIYSWGVRPLSILSRRAKS